MKEDLILRKVAELANPNVKFMIAEIENKPGQFGIMARQGINRIVLQADRVEMLKFLEAAVRDIRGH